MPQTLLSTKLNTPLTQQKLIPRHELAVVLAKASTSRLTLVCAPPGYGKTTLVSGWLNDQEIPSTWLSLDEGDNDPIRFFEYFLTALHKVVPAIRIDALDLLQGSQPGSFESVVALLVNSATGVGDFFLVLDDFHVLHVQPILDMLALLLDHLPTEMHLVLLSRVDPPLSLSRLRARGQLLEIRAEQLRFTPKEITQFFHQVLELEISGPDLSAIESRTEGWIAGLQLAGLAIKSTAASREDSLHNFIASFAGSHAYIMDYLTEEVLRSQDDTMRSFLLQTSILERMCAPLCQAVIQTGKETFFDGQAALEMIEKQHLFVIPLDGERRWYRYHHLFRDVLNRRLEFSFPEQIPILHRRASEWYEQNGFIHEAVQHTMKTGDSSLTARLVEQYGCAVLMAGETTILGDWLAAVEPYTQIRPWLAMQKAWVSALSGNPERAQQAIDAGERLLSRIEPTTEVNTLRGSFAAAQAYQANVSGETAQAVEHARRALDFLGDSSDFSCSLRSVATSLLGDASWVQGNMPEALRAYTDAVKIGQTAGNPHMVMMSESSLADVLIEQGQLHQAAGVCAEILRMAEQVDGSRSAYAQYGYFGQSKVLYAWNRLEEAARSIERCSLEAGQWRNSSLQAACLALTAQVEIARGNAEKAREALTAAEEQMNERSLSLAASLRNESFLARLWLNLGRAEKTFLLLKQVGICPDSFPDMRSMADVLMNDPILYRLEPACLILARLFLAQRNPDAALAFSERLLPNAQAGERMRTAIEIHILRALALQAKKDISRALEALERAIALAWPEESRRVFLDEGEEMLKLLVQAKARHLGGEFVEELLSCVDQRAAAEPSDGQGIQNVLVEPLSGRELEVLRCIAEGCSNQEIADRFYLSPKTVKRHISNIYGKLDAKNRTQAVSLARSLKLID